jgi:hypothetical protein
LIRIDGLLQSARSEIGFLARNPISGQLGEALRYTILTDRGKGEKKEIPMTECLASTL